MTLWQQNSEANVLVKSLPYLFALGLLKQPQDYAFKLPCMGFKQLEYQHEQL